MKSRLSFFEIFVVCIGSLLGMDIFIATGIVASFVGEGGFGVWLLVFPAAILFALCFAELSSMFKISGGPIVFVKSAFGDFLAFISGWAFWMTASLTISSLALAIPFYASLFVELGWAGSTMLSLLLIWAFTAINYLGVKSSANAQKVLTLIAVLIFIAFIFLGSGNVDIAKLSPLFPAELAVPGLAILFAFAVFIGWESVTIIAEEVAEPRRFIPKAIVLSAALISLIYLAVALVSFGSASHADLASSPLSIYKALGSLPQVALFVALGGVFINIAAMNSWILTATRLPYAMAKQKIFLKYFSKLSRHGTPHRSLALQALFSSFIVISGGYKDSVLLLLSNVLILYILNFLSLIKLKQKIKDTAFNIPAIAPAAAIIISLFLLVQISFPILFSGALMLLLGIPAYVLIKLTTDIKFIENFYDRFSSLFSLALPLWYGGRERDKVVRNARLKRSHTVLDYGCGSGYTTKEIAKRSRRVLAVDISRKQLEKAIRELHGFDNVVFLKESEMAKFKAGTFDRAVCSIAMDHFTKPQKQLSQLGRVLKRGGIASFLSFGKSLGILPKEFLRRDSSIRLVFKKAGFSRVGIERVKKLGSEYIYIAAKK